MRNRFPRTLAEAFGPYTSDEIIDTESPMHRDDKIVLFGAIAALMVFALVLFAEWAMS